MNTIEKAAKLLESGELVAFPTETVYGLGADATNPNAVKKIFELKGRPQNHPVIVHIYSDDQLKDWVKEIPNNAIELSKHFWPGPLTLIFNAKKSVSTVITGNQNTIGIRMPSHPIARELLKQFGKPIAAPSANRFGKVSPTKAVHVVEEFGKNAPYVIDGGDCPYGLESTIIDVTKEFPIILRPGPLDIPTLIEKTSLKIFELNEKSQKHIIAPRVSGNLESHYSPDTKIELLESNNLLNVQSSQVAVMSFQPKPQNFLGTWVTMPVDAFYYGKALYSTLRELDKQKINKILIELPDDLPAWAAVRDRLKRAAAN